MTKTRTSTEREIIGILGRVPQGSALQSRWNQFFAKQGIDAFCARYAATPQLLPERLSESFHFDRRLLIVAPGLRKAIIPLLDECDVDCVKEGPTVVENRGGVFVGHMWAVEPEDVWNLL